MVTRPENFEKVVLSLAKLLEGHQYAFRGTASLVLQGLEMNVQDIDILCDKQTALKANELLKEYLVEEVAFKESPQFKSYFGKFMVKDVPVEVMGEWQIKDKKGEWTQPYDGSTRKLVELKGASVYVTPVEEELAVFAKMGRWTAYQKIKKQLEKPQGDQPGLF